MQALISGQLATMIPFMTPALLGVETIEEGNKELSSKLNKTDLAFCHLAVTGAKGSEFFNEIILDKKELESKFGMTFAGHLHTPEKLSEKIQITGSVFTQEVGETEKFIYVYDTETKKTESVKLPVRGIRKIIWEERDRGELIPKETILKCYITDKKTVVEDVKKELEAYFDSVIIIEQYENTRQKVHFEEGGLDLSIESLLKVYADTKKVNYDELKEGFDLIK